MTKKEEYQTDECIICFCSFEDDRIYTCADPRCHGRCCYECMQGLIRFSAESGRIPVCASANCSSYYTLSCFNNESLLDQETLKLYFECSLDNFLKDKGEMVQKKLEEDKILAKLRDERLRYLEANFPEGISLVATICFNQKLRRIEKQKAQFINHKLKSASRQCMNISCGGFLDSNLVCLTCNSEFCLHCEVKIKRGHVCQQENLDSIRLVNNLIKCPGCKLPVFKNEGCDSITCSNCGVNFKYSTGEIGGHGSHNAKIQVDQREKKRLSEVLKDRMSGELLEKVLLIESMEPKEVSKDIILTPIRHHLETGERDKSSKQLARRFDRYIINKYARRDYVQRMIDLEEILLSSDETVNKVEKINKILLAVTN